MRDHAPVNFQTSACTIPTDRIYLCCGATDMRRKINGLARMVQQILAPDPHAWTVFCFLGTQRPYHQGAEPLWSGILPVHQAADQRLLCLAESVCEMAVGQRNRLFSGSLAAAQRSAFILSIIETCKANGVGAEPYMAYAMERIQNYWPASRWDELMPLNWSQPADDAVAIAT